MNSAAGDGSPTPAGRSLRAWGAFAGLAVIALLLLANVLTHSLSHDEQQYVAAAALAFDLRLYSDFLYLQTPYFPLLAGAAMRLIPGDPLLVARLLNWAVSVLSVLTLYAIARSIKAPRYMALGAGLLFASSSVAYFSLGTARNDMLPCLFALLGFYAALRASADGARHEAGLYFACGVALAAAVGSKITYAFAPATIVLFSLWRWRLEPRPGYLQRELLPLAGGGIVGAIPMIWLALPDPANFWYAVSTYHTTATPVWYSSLGFAHRLELPSQLDFFGREFLRTDSSIAATIWLATMLGSWATLAGRPRLAGQRGIFVLPLALLLGATIFAFIPKPSWVQYFVPVLPFLVLAPIFLHALLPASRRQPLAPLAVAVIAIGSAPGLARLALEVPAALDASRWTSSSVERFGEQIDAALQGTDAKGPIATLAPIYVLASTHAIYPEFDSGVFFFRTGDLESREQAMRLNAAAPSTLADVLTRKPPAAILVGVEIDEYVDVEAPLRQYAIDNGYRSVALEGPPAATLFLPPAALEP